MPAVRLRDIIAPSFHDIHKDIKESKHTHYWLKGGRGSTKSSFIAIEIILGIKRDGMNGEFTNGIALRRVKDGLRESVYNQLLWAIDILGLNNEFSAYLSPLKIVYNQTGQQIVFRGADNPQKVKSIKLDKGYFKYVWYEEVDEFEGYNKIENINQSLLRGGKDYKVFYSFNPPESQRNWANMEVLDVRTDKLVSHTTYETVPRAWLGEQFILEAKHMKKVKPKQYEHDYLGAVTGTGGEVFNNVESRRITDEEIATFDHIRKGMDFGFAADPLTYIISHYDKKRKHLYIFGEVYKRGLGNEEAVEEIKKLNNKTFKKYYEDNSNSEKEFKELQETEFRRTCIADSAEPRTISQFRKLGMNLRGAKKGPDSVRTGLNFMSRDIETITVDPYRCPNTKRELYGYEIEKDKDGNLKGEYPDKDNHSLDAIRYSLEDEIKNNKVRVFDKARLGL